MGTLVTALFAAKSGDSMAVGHFIDLIKDAVATKVSFIKSLTVEVEDAYQTAMLSIVKDLKSCNAQTDYEVMGWVTTVAKNKTLGTITANKAVKKGYGKTQYSDFNLVVAQKVAPPETQLEQNELFKAVMDGLEDLPQSQAEAIKLKYLEGKSLKEVSEVLGKSEMAVAGYLKRGLASLKAASASLV